MKKRRLGKFVVKHAFATLDNLAMRRLMEKVVVLQADYDYVSDRFEYVALCEDFDECPPHLIVPIYDVVISGDPVRVKFERRSD